MIIGKVAQIASDEEVVLNVGSQHGVKNDMEFAIYMEGDHVIDPETKEDLGAIEIVKGRVRVYHVMEKMSLARAVLIEERVQSEYSVLAREIAGALHTRLRQSKLEVRNDEVSPIKKDLVVKVGDIVRSMQ